MGIFSSNRLSLRIRKLHLSCNHSYRQRIPDCLRRRRENGSGGCRSTRKPHNRAEARELSPASFVFGQSATPHSLCFDFLGPAPLVCPIDALHHALNLSMVQRLAYGLLSSYGRCTCIHGIAGNALHSVLICELQQSAKHFSYIHMSKPPLNPSRWRIPCS